MTPEDLIQRDDLAPYVEEFRKKFPGLLERAFKDEKILLKPLIDISEDLDEFAAALEEYRKEPFKSKGLSPPLLQSPANKPPLK